MSHYLELERKRGRVMGGTKGVGEAVVATLRAASITVTEYVIDGGTVPTRARRWRGGSNGCRLEIAT